jgi:hypothetical protein
MEHQTHNTRTRRPSRHLGAWALAAVLAAGGCQSAHPPADPGGGPGTSEAGSPPEAALPVDAAWRKLAEDLARDRQTKDILGRLNVRGIPLAAFARSAGRAQADQATRMLGSPLSATAFEQTVDEVAAFLARELPMDPEVAKAQRKQVLAVAGIENRSTVPNDRLAAALDSLHSSLATSDAVRANFLVLARDAPKAQEALDAAGAGKAWQSADPLGGPAAGGPGFGGYHPATVYQVTGKFYQLVDERAHRLYLKTLIEVWRPLTGEAVKAGEFTREYRFHPYRLEWVAAADDDQPRAARGGQASAR